MPCITMSFMKMSWANIQEGDQTKSNLVNLARKLPLDEEVSDSVAQLRQMNNEMRKLKRQLGNGRTSTQQILTLTPSMSCTELNSVHEELRAARPVCRTACPGLVHPHFCPGWR